MRFTCIIGIFLLFTLSSISQMVGKMNYNDIQFKKIPGDEHVSILSVDAIFQDKYGFIWIGSNQGLVRYDGFNYKLYRQDKHDSTSISSYEIWDIFEDSYGQLWIATTYGLNKYNREKDNFIVIPINDNEKLRDSFIQQVEEHNKKLYITTVEGILCAYDLDAEKFIFEDFKTIDDNIKGFTINKNGDIFLASLNTGVYIFKKDSKYYQKFPDWVHQQTSYSTLSILVSSKGDIWVGTNRGGLIRYIESADSFKIYKHNAEIKYSIGSNIVRNIHEDKNHNIWICTEDGGLNLYLPEHDGFYSYSANNVTRHNFDANTVRSIYSDDAGNLWVGTFDRGLYLVDGNAKPFNTITYYKDGSTLSHSNVTFFHPDHKNNLWIGTDGGGLNYFNVNSKIIEKKLNKENTEGFLKSNKPLCAYPYKNGLLIGMWNGGLDYFDFDTLQATHLFPYQNYNTGNNKIWSVMVENDTAWLGTFDGIYLLDLKSNNYTRFTTNKNYETGTSSTTIWKILKASDGKYYIATSFGLNVYDKSTNTFKYYLQKDGSANSISSNFVSSLFEDSKKRIWVGTSGGGLNLFNSKKGQFKAFGINEGFADDIIVSIIEDNRGNLWLGSSRGLIKFTYETKEVVNFDKSDGLFGNNFKHSCAYLSNNGVMYFGGTNGFTYFVPDSIRSSDFKPKIAFTDFKLFNQSVNPSTPGSPLDNEVNIVEKIELTHKQSIFTVEFAAFNYGNIQKTLYQYYLKGFEDDWNPPSQKRQVTYTNLDPGTYTLKVRASNEDLVWSDYSRELRIRILPPFWNTFWFKFLSAILLLGAAGAFYYWRINSISRQKEQLEKLVEIRTKALNEKNLKVNEQNRKILQQMEELQAQRDQISLQNTELEKHRNNLEELVVKRTNDAIRAKEKAEAADKLKTMFLANLSHEIRTPLNAILGFIQLIGRKNITEEKFSRFNMLIQKNGYYLINLIENIIDFSRIESKELELLVKPVNLYEFIQILGENNQYQIKKENPKIKFEFINNIDKDLVVNIDEKRFKYILNQLIENAVKFTEEGYVRFKCERNEEFIEYTVEDTGIGIPKSYYSKVFNSFFKIENKIKLYRGTGIGLSICKELTRIMGGKIWVDKSEPGVGTTMKLILPVSHSKFDTSNELHNLLEYKEPNHSNIILLVEDEEDNYAFMHEAITSAGYTIVRAKNGIEAVEAVTNNNGIALVLMDIKMPLMDGVEATKKIREINDTIPIVAQTAFVDKKLNECLEAGCNAYLLKPIKQKELIKLIEDIVK